MTRGVPHRRLGAGSRAVLGPRSRPAPGGVLGHHGVPGRKWCPRHSNILRQLPLSPDTGLLWGHDFSPKTAGFAHSGSGLGDAQRRRAKGSAKAVARVTSQGGCAGGGAVVFHGQSKSWHRAAAHGQGAATRPEPIHTCMPADLTPWTHASDSTPRARCTSSRR